MPIITIITEKTKHSMPCVTAIHKNIKDAESHLKHIANNYEADNYKALFNTMSGLEVYDKEGLYAEFSIETVKY